MSRSVSFSGTHDSSPRALRALRKVQHDELAYSGNPRLAKYGNLCFLRQELRQRISRDSLRAIDLAEVSDKIRNIGHRIDTVASNVAGRNVDRLAMTQYALGAPLMAQCKDSKRTEELAEATARRKGRADISWEHLASEERKGVERESRQNEKAANATRCPHEMADLMQELELPALDAKPKNPTTVESRVAASNTYIDLQHIELENFSVQSDARNRSPNATRLTKGCEGALIESIHTSTQSQKVLPVEKPSDTKRQLQRLQDATTETLEAAQLSGTQLVNIGCSKAGSQLKNGSIPVWIIGIPIAINTDRAIGGTSFHGAFATGRPVHEETWVDLTNGASHGFTVLVGGCQLSKKKGDRDLGGATHPYYEIAGSKTGAVNGQYARCGNKNGYASFKNSKGTWLYRGTLLEAPNLGILSTIQTPGSICIARKSETDPLGRDFASLREFGATLATLNQTSAATYPESVDFSRKIRPLLSEPDEISFAPAQTAETTAVRKWTVQGGSIRSEADGKRSSNTTSQTKCPMVDIPKIVRSSIAGEVRQFDSSVDRVAPKTVDPRQVPLLCREWVLMKCPFAATSCHKRHYFASGIERDKWVAWRLHREQEIDAKALEAILNREVILTRLHIVAEQANKMYLGLQFDDQPFTESQQCNIPRLEVGTHDAGSRKRDTTLLGIVSPITALLDKLRVATVETVEAITEWSAHFAAKQRVGNSTQKATKKTISGVWIATIETDGRKVHDTLSPVVSKYKRHERGAIPAKRARVTKFLGVFESREEAEQAYEAAKPRVAQERRVIVQKLPPRVERETHGGVNVIETKGSLRLDLLEKSVCSLAHAGNPPPPAYYFKQQNYVVKMASDLDWLADIEPLRIYLGAGFCFKDNPLMLSAEMRAKVDQEYSAESESSPSSTSKLRSDGMVAIPTSATPASHDRKCAIRSLSSESLANNLPRKGTFNCEGNSFGTPTSHASRRLDGRFVFWNGSTKVLGLPHRDSNGGATLVLDWVRIKRAWGMIAIESKASCRLMIGTQMLMDRACDDERHDSDDDLFHSEREEAHFENGSIANSDGAGNRFVWAVYDDVEAKLLVKQERAALHGVKTSTFCQPESGKWKATGICGAALRSYWFRRRMQEEGKRRKAAREELAARLRKESDRGLIRLRPAKLKLLISNASALRGAGRLTVDAQQAKCLLDQRLHAEALSLQVSRIARGVSGRSQAAKRAMLLRNALEMKRRHRAACSVLAKTFVAKSVAIAVLRAARQLASPSHISTTCVNGTRYYALVHSLDHQAQSSMAAKQHWSTMKDTHHWRAPPLPSRILVPHFSKDTGTGKLRHDYSPLSEMQLSAHEGLYYKKNKRPPESLQLSIYDPATQEMYAKVITEADLRHVLIDAELSKPIHKLYNRPEDCEEIPKLVRLEAGAVSNDHIFYSHGIRHCRDRWEPVREEKVLVQQCDEAARFRRACKASTSKALLAACKAADERVGATAALEKARMRLAEAQSRSYEMQCSYMEAKIEAKHALEYSKSEVAIFDDPEAAIQENWRQVTEPFEDASNWKAFKRKRTLELACGRAKVEENTARLQLALSLTTASVAVNRSKVAEHQLEQAREALERASMDFEASEYAAQRARWRRKSALDAAISLLTLRQMASFGPDHRCREIAFCSQAWLAAKGPAERSRKSLRRFWSAACRKICEFRFRSFDAGLLLAKATIELRCIPKSQRYFIAVSQDPSEGTWLVVAESAGAGAGERKELILVPDDIHEALQRADRSELALPYITMGPRNIFFKDTAFPMNRLHRLYGQSKTRNSVRRSLATINLARKQRAQQIADVLISSLSLNVFNENLQVEGLNISRRCAALERRLVNGDNDSVAELIATGDTVNSASSDTLRRPDIVRIGRPCGRWLLDSIFARRSFLRGALIGARYSRIANRTVAVRVFDAWGDIRIETYEQKTGESHVAIVSFVSMLSGFLNDERYLAIARLLCAVPLNQYPKSVVSSLFDYLDFRLPNKQACRISPLGRERAQLVFVEGNDRAQCRGPIFSLIANISERVGRIRIYMDAAGGYSVTFSTCGSSSAAEQDSERLYCGPVLTLYLPSYFLLASIKAAARAARAYNSGLLAARRKSRRFQQRSIGFSTYGNCKNNLTPSPSGAPTSFCSPRDSDGPGCQRNCNSTAATLPSIERSNTASQLDSHQNSISHVEKEHSGIHENPIVVPDVGIAVEKERKQELFEFILQRLEIRDEDEALAQPVGHRGSCRQKHISYALEALCKFERWAATACCFWETRALEIVEDLRADLCERQKHAHQSRQCLALTALPVVDLPGTYAYTRAWSSDSCSWYTARVRFDAHGDFVISMARERQSETTRRHQRRESAAMGKEDEFAQRLRAFQQKLRRGSLDAQRTIVQENEALGKALEFTRLLRSSLSGRITRSVGSELQTRTEALDAARCLRKAICRLFQCLSIDESTNSLRCDSNRIVSSADTGLNSGQQGSATGQSLELVMKRAVALGPARTPWIVRGEFRDGRINFHAYEPSTSSRLSTTVSCAACVIEPLTTTTKKIDTFEVGAFEKSDRIDRYPCRMDTRADAIMKRSVPDAIASLAINVSKAHELASRSFGVNRASLEMESDRNPTLGWEKRHGLSAEAHNTGKSLHVESQLVVAALRVSRQVKLADFAVVKLPANPDAAATVAQIRAATMAADIKRLISAPDDVEVFRVPLVGTFVYGSPIWPTGTVLCCCDVKAASTDQPYNERATRICALYAQHEQEIERIVYGDALFLCPGNSNEHDVGRVVTTELIKQDYTRGEARRACRDAFNEIKERKVARIEEMHVAWMRHAMNRVRKIEPWLERAHRASEAGSSSALQAVLELRKLAESVDDCEDSFEGRVRQIRSCQDVKAVEAQDFARLDEKQLQPWQLWRAVITAHACKCQLPLAACSIPECVRARAAALAAGGVSCPSKISAYDLFVQSSRSKVASSGGSWKTMISELVRRDMEANIGACHQASQSTASQQERTEAEWENRRSDSTSPVISCGQCRRPKSTKLMRAGKHMVSHGIHVEISKRDNKCAFLELASLAIALQKEVEPTSPGMTPVLDYLANNDKAVKQGRKAAMKQCALGMTALTVPRALIAMLVSGHYKNDARGTPTGATQFEISDRRFQGNHAFFEWFMSRVSLVVDDASPYCIGRLQFDSNHGRTFTRLGSTSVYDKCNSYVVINQPPLKWVVGGSHSSVSDAMHLATTFHSSLMCPTKAISDAPTVLEDPGIVVKITILDGTLSAPFELSLPLTPDLLRGLLPSDEKVAAYGATHCLEYVKSVAKRAELARWLLRRANRVFYLKRDELYDENGELSVKWCTRMRTRHKVLAAMLVYAGDFHHVSNRGQSSQKLVTLPQFQSDSEDEELIGKKQAEQAASRVRAHNLRQKDARSYLRTVAREWPVITVEDERAHTLRPLMAASMRFVRAINDAFYTACAKNNQQSRNESCVQNDAQLELVMKRLLQCEASEGLPPEGRVNELKDEISCLLEVEQLPMTLFDMAAFWHRTRGERTKRMLHRRRNHVERMRVKQQLNPASTLYVPWMGASTRNGDRTTLAPSQATETKHANTSQLLSKASDVSSGLRGYFFTQKKSREKKRDSKKPARKSTANFTN